MWNLSAIKTFQTHDGGALSCNITRDGKKVGEVMDEGHGGMVDFRFINEQAEAEFDTFVRDWFKTSGEEAAWHKQMAEWSKGADREYDSSEQVRIDSIRETWVNKIADEIANKKRLDRAAKTKTLFMIEGDTDEGGWRTIGKAYCAEVQAFLDKKYGSKVTKIYGVK